MGASLLHKQTVSRSSDAGRQCSGGRHGGRGAAAAPSPAADTRAQRLQSAATGKEPVTQSNHMHVSGQHKGRRRSACSCNDRVPGLQRRGQ